MTDILGIIKKQREARGWSEYQLAERSGLPQSTISSWYKKGHDALLRITGKDLRSIRRHAFAVFLRWRGKRGFDCLPA